MVIHFIPGKRPDLIEKVPAIDCRVTMCLDFQYISAGDVKTAAIALNEALSTLNYDEWIFVRLKGEDTDADIIDQMRSRGRIRWMIPDTGDISFTQSRIEWLKPDPCFILIETPRAFAQVGLLLQENNVWGTALGWEDFRRHVPLVEGDEQSIAAWLRQALVLSAKAARRFCYASPSMQISDDTALRRRGRVLREEGHDGVMTIHPEQLKPLMDGFAPTAGARERAAVLLRKQEAMDSRSKYARAHGAATGPPAVAWAQAFDEKLSEE